MAAAGGAQSVVRRIIVFVILFAVVVIAAIGVSGLLERALAAGSVVADDGSGLARALTFTLIGVPLAGLLWWWERRRLAEPAERASLAWTLYLAAISMTALIVSTTSLAAAATAGLDGRWLPGELATGIVWAVVWWVHRLLRRSAATSPTRLPDLTIELSAVYGLVVAASGAIAALAALFSEALGSVVPVLVASRSWYVPVLQGLVWGAIGALVWWWHWMRERAKDARGVFAVVLLVLVVGAAAATTLFALGTVLFVLLRALFDTDPLGEVLSPLAVAIASALVGAVVWAYHARILAGRPARAREAGRLVVSAIALVGAASGFGVVVNALLATFGATLAAESDPRTLLLGGISALVVGAPVWWFAWRPARQAETGDAANPARRVYLIAIFGVSAIVAIVTLLLIGYRIFEIALGAGGPGGLLERIRAPLGLLSATVVVFAYHFAIWRHDRRVAGAATRRPTIGRIVLVAGGDTSELASRIRAETGAGVTAWRAQDETARISDDDLPALLAALEGVAAPRVLVVAQAAGAPRVTVLAD